MDGFISQVQIEARLADLEDEFQAQMAVLGETEGQIVCCKYFLALCEGSVPPQEPGP